MPRSISKKATGDQFNELDLATHRETGKSRIIRHIKFNSDGEMLLGFGKTPLGLVFAKYYTKHGAPSQKDHQK